MGFLGVVGVLALVAYLVYEASAGGVREVKSRYQASMRQRLAGHGSQASPTAAPQRLAPGQVATSTEQVEAAHAELALCDAYSSADDYARAMMAQTYPGQKYTSGPGTPYDTFRLDYVRRCG